MNQNAPTPEELRNLARAPQVDQPLLNEREFDPEEARQPRPLSGHPIVKLSIVGGCLLPIFLFAGIFLGSRQGIHNQNPQPTASTPPSASSLPEAQVNQREKLGQTQAQLALEKQRIELERLRQASSNKPIQKSVARSTTQSHPSANRPVAVAPSSYTPPQPMPRVVIPPERIAAVPPEIVKPVVRNVTRKRVESSEPLPPESSLTQAQKPESRLQSPIDQESSTQSLTDGVVKPRTAIVIAQGEPLQLMTTGTKAEGVLQTPIVVDQPIQQKTLMKPKIATDASQNISDDRFVVVLSETLQAHDRTIALPAGTEVVAQINSVSNNGLIKLDAVSAIVIHERQRTEIALPAGTIQIRGREGTPLIANRRDDKQSEIASRNTEMIALNGIRRASEIYTRSDSNLIINNGSIVSGNRKSGSDILAGILQGVSESLIDRAAERNKRAIAELQARPDIYQLNAGTPVEVYINHPVQLPSEFSQAVRNTQLPGAVLTTEIHSRAKTLPARSELAELDQQNAIANDN